MKFCRVIARSCEVVRSSLSSIAPFAIAKTPAMMMRNTDKAMMISSKVKPGRTRRNGE